jgi:hypothetical protein
MHHQRALETNCRVLTIIPGSALLVFHSIVMTSNQQRVIARQPAIYVEATGAM